MRWKSRVRVWETLTETYRLEGFGFAFVPRKVGTALGVPDEIWIFWERYSRISRWRSSYSSWENPQAYIFELGVIPEGSDDNKA